MGGQQLLPTTDGTVDSVCLVLMAEFLVVELMSMATLLLYLYECMCLVAFSSRLLVGDRA